MKLQILVPRYDEQYEDIKPLLDSIAIQQNVDFDEVGVIIRGDGDLPFNDLDKLQEYPFTVDYEGIEKCGVSATRNRCLDDSTANFVMFCDADDMFYNACGLWIIFREMDDKNFNTMISVFVEETRNPETKEVVYINHEMDSTFVHGKVHRRRYLMDSKIRFNDDLTIHEDSYFNILAQSCTEGVKYCQTPFYLWRWRDNSVCRHDEKYILKTFNNMIDSNDALIQQLKKRKLKDKVKFYVTFMVFDSYYLMNKPEWKDQENKEYRDDTEKRFAEYFKKYKDTWDSVDDKEKMQISNGVRSRQVNEGMEMESITISDWLKKIQELV